MDDAAGRELLTEFSSRLASWEWDAALLQEAPPWWPAQLARAAGAEHRLALTSRNAGSAVRRALARRWPDAMKSNGGGCNASDTDAKMISVGYYHTLSKQTQAYVMASYTNNDDLQYYGVAGGTGAPTNLGANVYGVTVSLKHTSNNN